MEPGLSLKETVSYILIFINFYKILFVKQDAD